MLTPGFPYAAAALTVSRETLQLFEIHRAVVAPDDVPRPNSPVDLAAAPGARQEGVVRRGCNATDRGEVRSAVASMIGQQPLSPKRRSGARQELR